MRSVLYPVAVAVIPFAAIVHCGAAQKPIRDVAIKVAADVCQEVATVEGLDPNLTELLCDDGSQIVKVLLPKKQWQAMKAAQGDDGGPGL
jgi:hypothetical protein